MFLCSLFRTPALTEGQDTFVRLKERLPVIFDIDPSLFTQSWLQTICDALRENPSLTVCHLSVMFDWRNVAAHFSIAE